MAARNVKEVDTAEKKVNDLPLPMSDLAISPMRFKTIEEGSQMKVLQPIPVSTVELVHGEVKKCQYGYPSHLAKPEKVIMVLGETGTGKSKFINAAANYLLKVEWGSNHRYKLIVEEGIDQSQSQTQSITTYTFHPSNETILDYTITIIDTPGYGDTRGKEQDKKITDQIQKLFALKGRDCIDVISGVAFVVKASQTRLTESQMYVYDSVLKIFGKDIRDNIFIIITFCDDETNPEALSALRADDVPFKDFFPFNNVALYQKGGRMMKGYWEMGEESFQRFFLAVECAHTVNASLTKQVLNRRRELELIVQGLPVHINKILAKIDEIEQDKKALQKISSEVSDNEDFTYEVTATKCEEKRAPSGVKVTSCKTCKFTCDENCICSTGWKYWCRAMNWKGYCKVCPDNCSSSDHENDEMIYRYYQVNETRTRKDIEEKYREALANQSKLNKQVEEMEKEVKDLNGAAVTNIGRACRCKQELERIALRPSITTVEEQIKKLIDQEYAQRKPGWKKRVEYFEGLQKDAIRMAQLEKANDP